MGVLVSISCMTYNHEKYIKDAIEGFLMQKVNFDYEILIGEDCSTDNTRQIVEKYVEKYPDKIRIITSEKNVGSKKNVLRVHKEAKGKYIAVCEGDDYWTDPLKLQKQVDYMENHPDCSLCYHAAMVVRADNRVTGKILRPSKENGICSIEDIFRWVAPLPTASTIYPKRLMDNPPEFYKKAPVGDYPLAIELSTRGYVYYIDEVMSAYRVGVKGSWTDRMKFTKLKIEFFDGILWMLKEFDSYSKYKYSQIVEKSIITYEIEKLILEKNFGKLKDSRYKKYYDSLSIKTKIKLNAKCYLPKLYLKLYSIKRYWY